MHMGTVIGLQIEELYGSGLTSWPVYVLSAETRDGL